MAFDASEREAAAGHIGVQHGHSVQAASVPNGVSSFANPSSQMIVCIGGDVRGRGEEVAPL